jgi:hypothetical protein
VGSSTPLTRWRPFCLALRERGGRAGERVSEVRERVKTEKRGEEREMGKGEGRRVRKGEGMRKGWKQKKSRKKGGEIK